MHLFWGFYLHCASCGTFPSLPFLYNKYRVFSFIGLYRFKILSLELPLSLVWFFSKRLQIPKMANVNQKMKALVSVEKQQASNVSLNFKSLPQGWIRHEFFSNVEILIIVLNCVWFCWCVCHVDKSSMLREDATHVFWAKGLIQVSQSLILWHKKISLLFHDKMHLEFS